MLLETWGPPQGPPVGTAGAHLRVVTVDVVEHVDEDLGGDAVQGDGREAARRLQLLVLPEVVIQQGPEVVAAATEEGLGEAGFRGSRLGGGVACPRWGVARAWVGPSHGRVLWGRGFEEQGGVGRSRTLWHRKFWPSTRKHTSGQLLKAQARGKGSSPRSPWGQERRWSHGVGVGDRVWVSEQAHLWAGAKWTARERAGPPLGTHAELRREGAISQQGQVLPEPGVRGGRLDSQHLDARARLGRHCGRGQREDSRWARLALARGVGHPKAPHTELGHLLALGLQVAEQVPQLALLGQALTVTDVLHAHVQAA